MPSMLVATVGVDTDSNTVFDLSTEISFMVCHSA